MAALNFLLLVSILFFQDNNYIFVWLGLILLLLFIFLLIAGTKNLIRSQTLKTMADIATIVSFFGAVFIFAYEAYFRNVEAEVVPTVVYATAISVPPTWTVPPIKPTLIPAPTITPTVLTNLGMAPKQVIEAYFNSLNSKDLKTAWNMFTDEFKVLGPDKTYDNFEEYWLKKIKSCNVISIEEISRSSDQAIVKVETTYTNSAGQETKIFVLEYHLILAENNSKWAINSVKDITNP